jgi:hypothetical protein
MTQRTDVVFVPRINVNEGLTRGQLTHACLVGTAGVLFIVPHEARQFLANTPTSNRWLVGPEELPQAVEKFLSEKLSLEKLEKELTTVLSRDKSQRRIFPVDQLERFAIQVGFWIFGGMSIQLAGEDRKVINVPGRDTRRKLRDFYAARLK